MSKANIKAIFETVKMALRYAILWLPVILQVIDAIETNGWLVGASIALTIIDKYLHENKNIPVKGIIPF